MRLIADRGHAVPRRLLVGLIWPGGPHERASHALSEALYKLRRRGLPICGDGTPSVWLPRESVVVDVERLGDRHPTELATLDCRILPGWTPSPPSPAFRDFADDWRSELSLLAATGLDRALVRARECGDWEATLRIADRLLELDPEHESAIHARADAAMGLHRSARAARPVTTAHVATPSARIGASGTRLVREPAAGAGRLSLPADGFPAARDTPLVGRDATLSAVLCLLDPESSVGGAAYISGPAGIGKSRLCREILSRARAAGCAVVRIGCQPSDRHRPLSVIVDAVAILRDLPGAVGCDPGTWEFLDRLTHHLRLGIPQTYEHADAGDLQGGVRTAVRDLMDAVTEERRLVLVVDDVQWADPISLSYLHELLGWTSTLPFVLVMSSREPWNIGQFGPPLSPLLLQPLAPLSDQDAAEHAGTYAALVSGRRDDALLPFVVRVAEGNPLLVEEMINHWVGAGRPLEAPSSVSELIAARVGRLSHPALRLLQWCAVLGKHARLDRIERLGLTGLPASLFAAVDELGTAGMLASPEPGTAAAMGAVTCRHELIAAAAEATLSSHGRAMAHREAARVLETELASDDDAGLLWDCARHWAQAGHSSDAVRLGLSCATHLLEIGLATQAVEACERVREFCVSPEDLLRVDTTLVQALCATREWDRLLETVTRVRGPRGPSGRPLQCDHDALELTGAYAAWRSGHDWRQLLDQALKCAAAESAPASHRIEAALLVIRIATSAGDPLAIANAYAIAKPILLQSESCDASELIALIYDTVLGDRASALTRARRLVRTINARDLQPPRPSVVIACATVLFRLGRPNEGERALRATYDQCLAHGMPAAAKEVCQYLIARHLDTGDTAAAEEWNARCEGQLRDIGPSWTTRAFRLNAVRLELARGRPGAAQAVLAADEEGLLNGGHPSFEASVLAAKLRIAIALGYPDRLIIETLSKLRAISDRLRSLGGQDEETAAVYDALRHLGMHREAGQLFKRYSEQERRDTTPMPQHFFRAARTRQIDPLIRNQPRAAVAGSPGCAVATDGASA